MSTTSNGTPDTGTPGTPALPPTPDVAVPPPSRPPQQQETRQEPVDRGRVMPRSAPPAGFPPPANGDRSSNSPAPVQQYNSSPRQPQPSPPQQLSGPASSQPVQLGQRGNFDPYGGYSGPQLAQNQSSEEELIQRFAAAINAVPVAVNAGPPAGPPARAPASNHSPIVGVNTDMGTGVLSAPTITAMDKDMYRISLILNHKRTLVSHLNAMSRALRLGTSGLKREKLERLLAYAQRLRGRGDVEGLRNMRRIVDTEAPAELRPLNGDGTAVRPSPPGSAAATAAQNRQNSQRDNQPAFNGYTQGYRNHPAYAGYSATTIMNSAMAQNPLAGVPAVYKLAFRMSPFYKLGSSLRPPVFFLKPYNRRRLTQTIPFDCENAILDQPESHVFLVCQEYHHPNQRQQELPPQPIYFPFYNELELDDEVLTANTRGIRGVVGSARPVDLKPVLLRHPNGVSSSGTNKVAGRSRHRLRITVVVNDQGERVSDKNFAFGVYYGTKVPHEQLVEEIKQRPHIPADVTRKMAMQAATADDGDDLVVSSDAVYSLKDNVMMTRITVPIRSRDCKHIDCFDALTFVMLQDQAETWKCPICNHIISWESLAVDEFFSQILETAGPEVDSVSIKADGTWSVEDVDDTGDESDDSEEDHKPAVNNHQNRIAEVVELLSETDDEAPLPPLPPSSTGVPPASSQQMPSPQQQQLQQQQQRSRQTEQPSAQASDRQQQPSPSPSTPQPQPQLQPQQQQRQQQHASGPHSDPEAGTPGPVQPSAIERTGTNNDSSVHTSSDGSPMTPDVARSEIYATIRAFQKSQNLMFDAPPRVSDAYLNSRTQSSLVSGLYDPQLVPVSSGYYVHPQGAAATPVENTTAYYQSQAQSPSSQNYQNSHSSQPSLHLRFRRPIRAIDDGDNSDNVIDLTGDD